MSYHQDSWTDIKESLKKGIFDIVNKLGDSKIIICLNIHNSDVRLPNSKYDTIDNNIY